MKKTITFLLAFLMILSAAFSGKTLVYAADSAKDQTSESPETPQIGDTLEDFTVDLVDGTQIKYSDILEDHQAVLINFFASWCHHCIEEFPAMQKAYERVSDDVAIIAISNDPNDTLEKLIPIKEDKDLTFYMGTEPTGMFAHMTDKGFPASLLVDRFGVVCWMKSGAIKDDAVFDRLFQGFIGDDYTTSRTDYVIPGVKPDVEPLPDEELTKAVVTEGSRIQAANLEGEYVWPFIKDEDGGIVSSNDKVEETSSGLKLTVDSKKGDVLSMEVKPDCNPANLLSVNVDGERVKAFNGHKKDWLSYGYAFESAGNHEVIITFTNEKNADDHEKVSIRNLNLLSGTEAKKVLAAVKEYPRSLEGQEMKIEILSDYKEVTIKADKEDAGTVYLLTEPKVKGHIAIGKDLTEEDVYFVSYDNESVKRIALTDLDQDEAGCLFRADMKGIGDNIGQIGLVPTRDDIDYEVLNVFISEDGLDKYVSQLSESAEGMDFQWVYADGSERETEAEADSGTGSLMSETAEEPSDSDQDYEVTFTDQNGNPVENVTVTICSNYCMMLKSDAQGKIVIQNAEGQYDIHVMALPDGYENRGESEVTLSKNNSACTLVLEKTE